MSVRADVHNAHETEPEVANEPVRSTAKAKSETYVSPRTSPQETERLNFGRQIVYARPISVLLALIAVVDQPMAHFPRFAFRFLVSYLIVSLLVIPLEWVLKSKPWHLPLAIDLLALGIILYISPFSVALWFPYLFVCYAAGSRWGLSSAVPIAGVLSLALVLRSVLEGQIGWMRAVGWLALVVITFAAGAGMAFLGDLSRRYVAENEFLQRITETMQVDQGLAESLRLLLDSLAGAFKTEEAMLAFRDVDLERIFLWRLKAGDSERLIPQALPLSRCDGFLLDDMDATVCWNSLGGSGSGFGWNRNNRRRLKTLPRLPGTTQTELKLRSLISVTFDQGGQPAGRIFLINRTESRKPFQKADLAWLERIARHVGPALENIFLLRHLRARAIEGERSRISRDLHDGILQTLLSIEIQVDVLRRKVVTSPEQSVASLTALQQTIRNESSELRRMVTDLRPLRVQSADLVELMNGFAERYRNESPVALDLIIDSGEIHASDRVCREIFQIYREALNNIKKHAKASHVVVKLKQDDAALVLVVDDNGSGFSFAGRFTGDELDRLRLGPISIKERARTVGGMLTVESNPGHGARLTIEIPLG